MTEVPKYDFSSAPTDDQLSTIAKLGDDLYGAEVLLMEAEQALKEARALRDDVAQKLIPQALDEAGLVAIETPKFKVSVKDVLRVSPRKDNRPLVLQRVTELGAAALIQATVSVAFKANEQGRVDAFVDSCALSGYQVKEERTIHSSRLRKFVADRLKAGQEVDMDLFGVTEFREAKFTEGGPTAEVFEGEGS